MQPNPKLVEIADRIVALKKFTDATGNQTGKSQTALMRDLDPIELSIVAALVNKELFSQTKDRTNDNNR